MHFQEYLCVCCAPASSCDLLGGGKLGQGCTHAPALCSSTPPLLQWQSGRLGPTMEMFCNTSCCVGSLRVASGSDLLSCLLEYNCSLLIFFFSFAFDSVVLVPYSDSSSISQSGESEEIEN